MKIQFYTYALNMGGIERTVAGLANLLCREHEVLVTQYTADTPFYELDSRVRHSSFGFCARGNVLSRTLRFYRAVRAFIRKERPDVVFCLNLTHLILFCLAARGTDTAVIGAERANPKNNTSPRAVRLRKFSVHADGFVFQTERAKSAYPQRTVERSAVIENAIWNEDVLTQSAPVACERRVISVGRLMPVKGYDLLIDAFFRVADEFPDWTLHIYGEGEQRAALEAQIAERGLDGRVSLPGADLHAHEKVRASEVFVLSSRSEGMPNTLLEAMACGTCCISADCPNGPSELIESEKNGLLFEPESVDAMAMALRRVMGDSALRARLAREGARKLDSHRPETVAQAWLDYACQVKKLKQKR